MYRKTFLKITLSLFPILVLIPGLHMLAQAGGGQVIYLPVFAGAASCSVPSAARPTIQSAVDEGCIMINLTAALYVENVSIENHSVIIKGQGPTNTTVDGNAADSVFYVDEQSTLTLEGLTVTNGGSSIIGGGILNRGTLHVANTVVRDNHTTGPGGGIASPGPLTLENSWVISNTAQINMVAAHGGGIYLGDTAVIANTIIGGNAAFTGGGIGVDGSSTVTIINSQILDNYAYDGGGILTTVDGTTLISNSKISNNEAGGSGGGILNGGEMQITGSQIMGNMGGTFSTSLSCGGGILNSGADFSSDDRGNLLIERTEIRDNSAHNEGGGICNMNFAVSQSGMEIRSSLIAGNSASEGGGIFSWTFPGEAVLVENSTLVDNSATLFGGAIRGYNIQLVNVTITENDAPAGSGLYSEGSMEVVNTIVAGNLSSDDCDEEQPAAAITSLGHNIDSDNSCNLIASGDMPNTDPLLGPLQNNGGPTHTTAIPSNSPAKDSADNAACPPTDQRGVIRPQGAGCDIGAYEYNG